MKENTRMVSIVPNVGFATVFAFAFVDHIENISLSAKALNEIYFGLAISAAVASFFLLLLMVREFKKDSNKKYDHYYRKKSESFSIFGLFCCMTSATIFSLQLKDYRISKDITPMVFLLAILFLSISRHYRHVARKNTRGFTSVGSTLTFIQLLAAMLLCDQITTHLAPSFKYENSIAFALLGISLIASFGLIIKDVFDLDWGRKPYIPSIVNDMPRNFPYKVSRGLKGQILGEFSEENFLFFKSANEFYYSYIRNNGNLTSALEKKLRYIYKTFIIPDKQQNTSNEQKHSRSFILPEANNDYEINVGYELREQARNNYSLFLDDSQSYKTMLLDNLNAVYEKIRILNRDTYTRYKTKIQKFSSYIWLMLPSIGILIGGLSSYGIWHALEINDLYIIAGCMIGWAVGYGMGEYIIGSNTKFATSCREGMDSLNNKCFC